jgi:hypothetical protein
MEQFGQLMSIGIQHHLSQHQPIVLFDFGMFKLDEKEIFINLRHHVVVVHLVMMEILFYIPTMMSWENHVK